MAGRRHVVAKKGPGAEEKVGLHVEFGDAAGDRSSSETLSTVTATATAAHSAQQVLKRLLERHTHAHKDLSKDDSHNPGTLSIASQAPDTLSVPTTICDSPTPTQFSPTSTLVMASPPITTSKLLASPSKVRICCACIHF